MKLLIIYLFYLLFELIFAQKDFNSEDLNEDAILRVPELVRKYNYPCEVHHVETQDGYILEMHRIPFGIKNDSGSNTIKKRPVVFLQHGLLASSACWLITGPKRSLGYLMADKGYDVWLGNARGSTYSRNHTSLSPENGKFWDFSWHEIGVYDLPAMIDYVRNYTNNKKIFYVGHSQGTTSFFVMTSERPEYNQKIRLAAMLAPVAYMEHLQNKFLKLVAPMDTTTTFLLKLSGQFEFLPSSKLMAKYGNLICNEKAQTQQICGNVWFEIFGYNEEQIDPNDLPTFLGHFPSGSSTKQLIHYAQEIHSGKFAQYDYGSLDNFAKYKSYKPPNYNLSKITAPVALYYSVNDLMAAEVDVERLYSELGNPVLKKCVPDKKFNHMDFCTAKDAVSIFYNHMFAFFKNY